MGSGTGTLFLPLRKDGARKAWLGGRMRMMGSLAVDAGCGAALAKGGSLLATGHHRGRRRRSGAAIRSKCAIARARCWRTDWPNILPPNASC